MSWVSKGVALRRAAAASVVAVGFALGYVAGRNDLTRPGPHPEREPPAILQQGDVDGDGIADLVSYGVSGRPGDDPCWYRVTMGGIAPECVRFARRIAYGVAVLDLDGDGLADMVNERGILMNRNGDFEYAQEWPALVYREERQENSPRDRLRRQFYLKSITAPGFQENMAIRAGRLRPGDRVCIVAVRPGLLILGVPVDGAEAWEFVAGAVEHAAVAPAAEGDTLVLFGEHASELAGDLDRLNVRWTALPALPDRMGPFDRYGPRFEDSEIRIENRQHGPGGPRAWIILHSQFHSGTVRRAQAMVRLLVPQDQGYAQRTAIVTREYLRHEFARPRPTGFRCQFMDINGDGLTDLVTPDGVIHYRTGEFAFDGYVIDPDRDPRTSAARPFFLHMPDGSVGAVMDDDPSNLIPYPTPAPD